MGRVVWCTLSVVLLLAIAGCPGLVDRGPTPTPESTLESAPTVGAVTERTSASQATAVTSSTATTTRAPTVPPTQSPRIVAANYDPDYSLSTVLERVEELRGLDATEQIRVEEVETDTRRRDGTRLELGDRYDPPDRAGQFRERAAKALQLYSSARVPYHGHAAAGTAGATRVTVGNESHFERLSGVKPAVTVVHELAHVLQQQHGLLGDVQPAFSTDARYARNAMTEGDASLTAQEYWERYDPGGVAPLERRNGSVSRARWRLGLSDRVRLYGARYLRHATETPAERNAAVRDPPNTTAELIHPTLERDLPAGTVPRPDVQWSARRTDRVGELTIRHALRVNNASYSRAAAASTGWRNGTLQVYRTPDSATVYWGTRWANASDASEFADTWRSMLATRSGVENGTLVTVPGTEHTTTMHYVIRQDGPLVYVAAAENASHVRYLSERFPSHGQ